MEIMGAEKSAQDKINPKIALIYKHFLCLPYQLTENCLSSSYKHIQTLYAYVNLMIFVCLIIKILKNAGIGGKLF